MSWDILYYTATGSVQRGADNPNYFSIPNANIKIRCDRGVAQVGSDGCILPEAAPVYVLDSAQGSVVQEAAEHVREAQNGPLKSPGKFLLKPGTRAVADSSVIGINALQRLKYRPISRVNQRASCGSQSTSLIESRIPLNQSASCGAATQTCSCDEYPFASTWNGGNFAPNRTSVKRINAQHNATAGSSNLTNWYLKNRVLDYTIYTGEDGPMSAYDPNLESSRGGDDFWVFIR